MKNGRLRVLHTSDWHLGHVFSDRKRDDEFRAFLDWLAATIKSEQVDCLLVAGDIYDTSTPASRIQELYYEYLRLFQENGCRHIVITAGNHDPAILLQAPRALLRGSDIHVLGEPDMSAPENEVLVLRNGAGEPELLVCAVPFLRERHVRRSAPGESPEMKEEALLAGIIGHYAKVAEEARRRRDSLERRVPVIAMGHLFAGGERSARIGESERILYVGTLGQISCEAFDPVFDYVALGHLHISQQVDREGRIRYSGSPLAMNFGESGQRKSVLLIEFDRGGAGIAGIEELPVPQFRRFERIAGDWAAIESRINEMKDLVLDWPAWLEILYDGADNPGDLKARLEDLTAGTNLEVLRISDMRLKTDSPWQGGTNVAQLGELSPQDVFERCLLMENVPRERWNGLISAFNEICLQIREERSE